MAKHREVSDRGGVLSRPGLVWFALLLVCVGFAGWCAKKFHAMVFAPDSRVALLMQPSAVAAKSGLIHAEADVGPAGDGGLLPCAVEYRKSKSSYSLTVHEGAELRLVDGRRFSLGSGDALELFGPDPRTPATEDQARRVRAAVEDLRGERDAEIHCLSPSERVYVQGCAVPGTPSVIGPCEGDDGVFLVPGGSKGPLVASFAGHGVGVLGLGLLVFTLAMLSTWWVFAYPSPVVVSLAQHARATARTSATRDAFVPILLATLVLGGVVFLAIRGWSGFYVTTMAAVVAAFTLAWFLALGRAGRLSAALRIIRDLSTTRIADATGALHELSVRVSPHAALVPSLHGDGAHAFVQAIILETHEVSGQKKKHDLTSERARLCHPPRLLVEDASGTAMLDMTTCALAGAEQPNLEMKDELVLPVWAIEALEGPIVKTASHKKFEVRWMALDAGDPLLVYGEVERTERTGDDTAPAAVWPSDYRSPPVALALRGKTIAHAGSEAHLERALRRERRVAMPVGVLAALAAGITIALCIYTATLV